MSNNSINKKMKKKNLEKAIGFDSLTSDLSSMGTRLQGIYGGWQTPETMASIRPEVVKMHERLKAYQDYERKYLPVGGVSFDTSLDEQNVPFSQRALHTSPFDYAEKKRNLQTASLVNAYNPESFDALAEDYGQHKTADSYTKERDILKSLGNMTSSEVDAEIKKIAAPVTELEGILKRAKEYESEIQGYENNKRMWESRSHGVPATGYDEKIAQAQAEYDEYLSSLDYGSIEDIENALNSLNSKRIAYTTAGGENITWQNLYDQKKYREESEALYTELSSKDDFEEYSRKGANIENPTYAEAEGGAYIFGWRPGAKDIENKVEFAHDNATDIFANNMYSSNGVVDIIYAETTDTERQIYNYYLAKEREGLLPQGTADEYLNSIYNVLKDRNENKWTVAMGEYANEHPVWASALSVGANVFAAPVEYIRDTYNYHKTGELDTSHASELSSTIRSTVSQKVDWEIGGWDAFDFVYNTGMSMADSAVAMATFKGMGGFVQGISAAAQGTNDALERGLDNKSAFWNGFMSGAFESIFESLSIGNFKALKETSPDGIKAILKNLVKSMLVNASEETLTELANITYDIIVNGDFSQYETDIRAYMNSGMSESEAKKKVALENGARVLEAGASGMLMGLGFGSLSQASAYSKTKKIGSAIRSKNRVGELLDVVQNMTPQEADAYKTYEKYAKKGITADNITDAQLGNLYASVTEDAIKTQTSKKSTEEQKEKASKTLQALKTISEKGTAKEDAAIREEELAKKAEDITAEGKSATNNLNNGAETKITSSGKSAQIQGIKVNGDSTTLVTNEGDVSVDDMTFNQRDSELVGFAQQIAEESGNDVANVFLAQYDGKTDVEAYANSFNLVTEYAKKNFTQDIILSHKGSLTTEQAQAIYNATVHQHFADIDKNKSKFARGTFDDSIIDYKNTTTDGSKVNWESLTKSQKNALRFAQLFSRKTGVNIRLIQSTVENGMRASENGSYDPNTNTIEIDVYAGFTYAKGTVDSIIPTLSHELTHWAKNKAGTVYEKLRNKALTTLSEATLKSSEELIDTELARLRQDHPEISYTEEDAIDEIVARFCEDMLSGSKSVREMLDTMSAEEKKTFLDKIEEMFNNLIDWVNSVLKQYKSGREEAKILRSYKDTLEDVQKLWDEMLTTASESTSETSVAKVEAPVVKTEAPVIKKETTVAKAETPVIKSETPVVKAETPVAKVETETTPKPTPTGRVLPELQELIGFINSGKNLDDLWKYLNSKENTDRFNFLFDVYPASEYATLSELLKLVESGVNSKKITAKYNELVNKTSALGKKWEEEFYRKNENEAKVERAFNVLRFYEVSQSAMKNALPYLDKGKADAVKYLKEQMANVEKRANGIQIGSRNLSDFSDAKTTGGKKLFQYRAIATDKDVYRDMLLKHKDTIGITNADIDSLFNLIDMAVDKVAENVEILDYAWDTDIDDRAFMPVKPNSDSLYRVSLDFSTLCRKRLLQQTIQALLQDTLNKQLSREESIAIRDELIKIQEEGRQIEVACALCYVESARMKSPVQINKFLDNREKVIREFFAGRSGGDIKEKIKIAERKAREKLKRDNPNGMKGKNDKGIDILTSPLNAMLSADAEYIRDAKRKAKMSYKLTEHEEAELKAALEMSVSDFTSAEGLENLAKNHKDLFDAYTSYIRNATHSKGIEKDTWWRAGDSDLIGDNLIRQMNEENGLRSQSWSDFQVIHLLDYIAATIELSTKGAKRQSYTKVPDYVKLLGNTGDMINMSLIPTRAFTGKLEYDPVEGMAYEIAKELRNKYHSTVGTICIGIANEQIKMLLADSTIDMVIPYHKSSMAKTVRKLMHIPSWMDYESYQQEGKLSDADAKANAKKYGVKLVKDAKYQKAPKFSEWFDLAEARQIAEMENANPTDATAYKKYGVMYGGYMAMQNAAKNYLKLCAERGLSPKFSHPDADFTSEANYWKLLIDRKMVDNVTGEVIEQKAIKPIFNQDDVLGILDDELERYPSVKADQEYATRKVFEKFMSGDMKVDESTTNAIKVTTDNIAKVNILESGTLLKKQNSDRDEVTESTEENYRKNCEKLVQMKPVANLIGTELDGDLTLKEKITMLFNSWGNAISTERFGDVALTNSSIRSEFRHGTTRGKVISYVAIPSVLKNGVVIDIYKKNHGEVERVIVAAPITIFNKPYFMGVMIQRDAHTNRLYLHDVIIKKEASEYQAQHLNTTGAIDTENLLMTEVLEKAISIGYMIPQTSKIVKRQNSDRQQSIPTDEIYDIMGENDKPKKIVDILTADIERWKERLKMEGKVTNGQYFADSTLTKLAEHIRKQFGSTISRTRLVDMLRELTQTIHSLDTSGITSDQLLNEHLLPIAYAIAEQMSAKPNVNEKANSILNAIRDEKIVVSENQIADLVSTYDSHWNRAFFGKLNVSKGEQSNIDEVYARLREEYPGTFPEVTSDGDMLPAILDVYNRLKDAMYIEEQFNLHEVAMDIARELYTQCWNLAPTKTVADKYTEKIKALKTEHSKAMRELKETYEDRADRRNLADDMYYVSRIINNIRKRDEMTLDRAKKQGRERLDKYKENADRKTVLQRIRNDVLDLSKKLLKNSKDQHIPEVLKPVIVELVTALDFSSKRMLDKGIPTQKDISLYKALEKVQQMMLNATNGVEGMHDFAGHGLDEQTAALVSAAFDTMRDFGDNEFILINMSLENLAILDEVVRSIKHVVNTVNQFYIAKHSQGTVNLSQKSVSEMNELGDGKKYNEKSVVGRTIKLLNWKNINPLHAFKRFGEGGRIIFEALQDGWDKFAFNIKAIIDFTEKTYTDKEVKKWSENVETFEITKPATDKERADPDYTPKKIKVRMTTAQIMSLYCLNKREQAKGHLLGGGMRVADFEDGRKTVSQTDAIMLTQNIIDEIIGRLDERTREVADKLQEFLNTVCTDWGNEISMLRFGYNAFGELNYFPIESDANYIPGGEVKEKQNSLFRLLNMSFAKELTEKANNAIVVRNIFDVFAQHSSDMAKYNALALPVLDALRWYNYTEKAPQGEIEGNTPHKPMSVRAAMEKAFGKDAQTYFTTFLQDINGTQNVSRDTLGSGFFKNSKVASVGANLRVVLLQPTSYLRAGAVIDNRYLTRALMHKPKISDAIKHCGMALWKSLGYYDTNVQRGVEEQIKHSQTKKDKAVEWAMKGAEVADKITWGYLWNACELEIRDKRKDLKVGSKEFNEAVGKRLRDVIYATQVVDSTMTRSEMMRSSDRLDKMLTAFGSEPTLAYNMLYDAYMDIQLEVRKHGKKYAWKKHGKKVARVIAAYTITNIAAALVETGFDAFRDDDEEEKDLAYFMRLYLTNFASDMSITGKIPYVKELHSILKGFGSSRADTQWMETLSRLSKEVIKAFGGDGDPAKIVKNFISLSSQVFGLPFYNLYRDLNAGIDLFTGADLEEMFNEFFE